MDKINKKLFILFGPFRTGGKGDLTAWIDVLNKMDSYLGSCVGKKMTHYWEFIAL